MGGASPEWWSATRPSGAGLLLAVGARATADQIGTQTTQIAAIKADPTAERRLPRRGGGTRTPGCDSLVGFAHHPPRRDRARHPVRQPQPGQRGIHGRRSYAVQSYLASPHKLLSRFDAGCYVTHRGAQQPRTSAAAAARVPWLCAPARCRWWAASPPTGSTRCARRAGRPAPGQSGPESSSRPMDTTASGGNRVLWAN